jgi:TolB protein
MAADGSNPRNLTQNNADDFLPVWSPDGRQIAFVSDRDGNMDIYLMAADGSGLRNLTNNSAIDYLPVWRPAPPD